MTTKLYSKTFLRNLLASIPTQFEQMLIVQRREPNTLQLLKLSIQAFFNNILICPFLESHGNDILKALWLLQNIQCAQNIFEQYNFLDYYPFIDDNGTYMPSFVTNLKIPGNTIHQWNILLEWLPNILAAVQSLKKVRQLMKIELLQRLDLLATTRNHYEDNFRLLSINLMYDIGEYNNTLDKFIDMFLPIDRHDEKLLQDERDSERHSIKKSSDTMFTDKSICLLTRSRDGGQLLTILPDLNK